MTRLLELAGTDNPMLVEYTKRWVQTREPSSKEEVKLPDPVTAARAWSKRNSHNFLAVFFVAAAMTLCDVVAESQKKSTSVYEWSSLFMLILSFSFGYLVTKGLWHYSHKTKDTKKFMKAITLLESIPVNGTAEVSIPMGSFARRVSDWEPATAHTHARKHLCALGGEIVRLEHAEQEVLWRVAEKKARAKKMRDQFGKRHYFFRRLLPSLPEQWGPYFGG